MLLLLFASLLAVAAGGKGGKGGKGGRGEMVSVPRMRHVCALFFQTWRKWRLPHFHVAPQKRGRDGILQAAHEVVAATVMRRSSFRWVCRCVGEYRTIVSRAGVCCESRVWRPMTTCVRDNRQRDRHSNGGWRNNDPAGRRRRRRRLQPPSGSLDVCGPWTGVCFRTKKQLLCYFSSIRFSAHMREKGPHTQ